MPKWIHLNLSFKNYQETAQKLHDDLMQDPPVGIYKELIFFLKKIVDALQGSIISKYFFLFEGADPGPNLFLALEMNGQGAVDEVMKIVNEIVRPDFIESIGIQLSNDNESNGEAAIDFFYASSKYAFYRVGSDYKPGYVNNDPAKLVHCLCNQLFFSWEHEKIFLLKCLRNRGYKVEINRNG